MTEHDQLLGLRLRLEKTGVNAIQDVLDQMESTNGRPVSGQQRSAG